MRGNFLKTKSFKSAIMDCATILKDFPSHTNKFQVCQDQQGTVQYQLRIPESMTQ
jgi:hypothetical protein